MTRRHPAELIARSNRLGRGPARTPTTPVATPPRRARSPTRSPREPTELLWVKGSGGDLGTLTEGGLAVLRLDRLRALVDVYPGVDREDEMVAAFDYCLHGNGGAAPSIDTAMHGSSTPPHIDHLHPDSGIALATAADGEALTKECFGDRVAWVRLAPTGLPARARHRRGEARQPAGHRRGPRRPRHHRLGRHVGGVRGPLARDHPHRRGLPRRARQGRALRRRRPRLRGAAGRGRARPRRPPWPR